MQRYKIVHHTYYNFSAEVQLEPHALRLRPREDHEVRIESSRLEITPPATLRWHRDVEGNSVAIASFDSAANQLTIKSEIIIQHFNKDPLDFLVSGYAVNYPFSYQTDDQFMLSPCMVMPGDEIKTLLTDWIATVWQPGQQIQTYTLLLGICKHIHATLHYRRREEPGVQTAQQTLSCGTGSCRDFSLLLMDIARCLGLAARFVSGYLHTDPLPTDNGSTHAWAEIYIPGAGWKGFDPTVGELAGPDHIAVAVARLAESVPPVAGSFVGIPGSNLDVGVWVTRC